ncbi:MAG: RNA polymerase sigma-70 factor [Tannerellaceae bacterium]|jgi:RNA polymerase sigma-70 factor (ECF subfamily)|nr:RNA polymerase sigma-70 factor [Tannerellaceae bacterium]
MDEERKHVKGLRDGSYASFDCLYGLWSGKLYNFVMRMSRGERYLAEEIVQSAFLKIWENRESLDEEKTFSTYLFTIAKNLLLNVYQHRMQEFLYQEKLLQDDSAAHATEKEMDYRLLDEYIDSLIAQLPPARRQIFILSRRRFLSNKEIAAELGLSENTVESQLRKAIAFLREEINKHYNS